MTCPINRYLNQLRMIADDLRVLADAALIASTISAAGTLVFMIDNGAALCPVMAVGTDCGAFEGAQPHGRVLHQYRNEESELKSGREQGSR